MKIRAILTGATGMVGAGVLLECLQNPDVEHILVLSRRASGITHPKVTELLHADLQHLGPIENQLTGFNACFFCAGISSIGISQDEYVRITHDLTLAFAQTMLRLNPAMTFTYVSGHGTDSSEQGRSRWARVKGRTENELLALPFRQAYMFRPGYMHPTPSQANVPKAYRYIKWFYPIARQLTPAFVSTMQELALAMIKSVSRGYPKRVLEVPDIVALAHGQTAPRS